MTSTTLGILGAGIVTDGASDIGVLADRVHAAPRWRDAISRNGPTSPEIGIGQDTLCQLALRAIDPAWRMAQMQHVDSERIGLIVQTAWGTIDSTAAYLESMLEADGRYASPRHFSRSVYSSVASVAAIQFGIRGPCETLAFDAWPLQGALRQAWRLLATKRCDRVLVVWCEQAGDLATDLARRAAELLRRGEFDRYADGLGYGAVAMVLALDGGLARVNLENFPEKRFTMAKEMGKPFAMDTAVALLAALMRDNGFEFRL